MVQEFLPFPKVSGLLPIILSIIRFARMVRARVKGKLRSPFIGSHVMELLDSGLMQTGTTGTNLLEDNRLSTAAETVRACLCLKAWGKQERGEVLSRKMSVIVENKF